MGHRFPNIIVLIIIVISITSSHCCLSKLIFETNTVAAAAANNEEEWKWDLPYLLELDAAGDSNWVSRCERNHQELSSFEDRRNFNHKGDDRFSLEEKEEGKDSPRTDDCSWVSILDEEHASLKEEFLNIPTELYMPYCHHDNCNNDDSSWQIFPLMIMDYKVTTNLALLPVVGANLLEKLIKNIPGLISVAISLSESNGHIKPHIDSTEGQKFIRHLYGISVPLPHARINVCGNKIYEFSEKTLFSFNNSKPHEVINPSSSSRIVLIIDVLLNDIYSNENLREKQLISLIENEWDSTLTFLKNYDKKNNNKRLQGTNINLKSSSLSTSSSSLSQTPHQQPKLSIEEQFWEESFKGKEWISNEGHQYRLKTFSWSRDSEYTDWYRVGEFHEVRNGVEQKRQYSLSVNVLKKTKWLGL
jgi:hypothetical protein